MNIVDTFKNDLRNALSKGVLHLSVSLALTQLIAFLQGIVMAKILGPKNLGHVRVIQSVLQIASVPAGFGISTGIAKYVSEYQQEEQKKRVFSQGMLFNLFTALIVSFAVLLLCQNTVVIKDDVARYYLQFMCWTLLPTVVTLNILYNFQGKKQIKQMAIADLLLRFVNLVMVCYLCFVWMLRGYVTARLVFMIGSVLILFLWTRRNLISGWDKGLFRRMFGFSGFATLSASSGVLRVTVDTLCISTMLGDAELVGYYGLAIAISSGLTVFASSVTKTAFPYISERSDDLEFVWRQIWRLTWKIALYLTPLYLLIIIFSPFFIRILLPGYLPAVPLLRILAIAYFLRSLGTVPGSFRVAVGRTDVTFYGGLLSSAVNVVLNIVFIKRYGVIGAAYATAISFAIDWLWAVSLWKLMLTKKI